MPADIRTISCDQSEILKWIMDLYLGGESFELDPTYGYGGFYKFGIPEPSIKSDNRPLDGITMQADCTRLPLPDESIESIIFDPPFLIGGNGTTKTAGRMRNKFGWFRDRDHRECFYLLSLIELHRVLKNEGVLAFKCQDEVYNHINVFTHVFVHEAAVDVGFTPVDLFILLAKSRIGRTKIKCQEHARKFHCYFWVLRKPK